MEETKMKKKRQVEKTVLDKVEQVINSINVAKHVDQLILSLHSLASLLFPLDSRAFSGSIDERYRDQVLSAKAPSVEERESWWEVFYGGASFPTLSRLLLYDVALNWLPCFPMSSRKHVYDVFFVSGRATEVVQTLVVALRPNGSGKLDNSSICSNAERLVALCLLENNGVLHMAREFSGSCSSEGLRDVQLKADISRIAQLVTSIPDKARVEAPKSLSSHLFFKQITIQILSVAEELDTNLCNGEVALHKTDVDGTIIFVGELFSRICRRGSADVLLSKLVPEVLKYVRGFLLSKELSSVEIEPVPVSGFWSNIIGALKDPYTVKRISEQILRHLATQDISDVEAYWILWLLFHRSYENQASVRCMFVENFLLWKVFPVRCLRWILQFAIRKCPPDAALMAKGSKLGLVETMQHLVTVWSKREFVQSASVEQQAYVTAAIGLSLEQMSKEDLDATKDGLQFILQGVSCRLESPSHLIRKMASCVALVFSKVIDPKNPLYLDDLCPEENIDWEFGMASSENNTLVTTNVSGKDTDEVGGCGALVSEKDLNTSRDGVGKSSEDPKRKKSEFVVVDPDEVIDPAMLNNELISDEEGYDDDADEDSETSSNSSLQPYDLSDDDTDLKKNFSQLVDVIGALRKSDDADGVERALNVAEKLIRASPDELKYVAGDLSRTLVQARCFDSSIDGEEDSAEEKRQKALVALVAMSPLECLDTLNKLLYSPNLDVSQRIMILDVMTNAAQELSHAKTTKPKVFSRAQISTISETQTWFMPSSVGPPGAGPWREISRPETPLNWSYSYERELPSLQGKIGKGKSRRWSSRKENTDQLEWSENRFPQYAAAFMLPSMQGFDKKRHGVDLLGRDFIVLGKLVYMLGICMKSAAMHPEASVLALPLMDMLSSRTLCHHVESYVRRSVLFAASCILVALHPSYVASALAEGNSDVSKGLERIRTWALHVAESDTDRECYTMAMACLQLHAEMALQASRAMESADSTSNGNIIGLPSNMSKKTIKIPLSNVTLL
ncbi:telomere length regulation protein TEL2-like [Heracleum sosnowskyi]|uniref:Telomere length regulation protein TEL2-like n=1 Tax=Heracleum sosnowskyi TaxID=360622 RepID=A0AAD8M2K7_9APIA|nr:telomere length regulation protein TEL2-like [Heracleum sosnowskyi]